MIPVDEFYSFSDEKQETIVSEGQVAVDGKLASSVPTSNGNVHIFEAPIEDEVINTLQGGHYTIEDLVAKFPLKKRVIESIVSQLRHRPERLLEEYHSIVRVADTQGTAYVYTIEPLPYEVRAWDPTLGFHLIQQNSSISVPNWKSERKSWESARDTYVRRMEDYWGLPESELPETPYYNISFGCSTLGPLPKSIPDHDPKVRTRLRDVDGAYKRKQYEKSSIKHRLSYYKSACRRNPSLATFQAFALYLHDLAVYIDTQAHPEFRSLLQGGTRLFFACLFGGYRVRKATGWVRFDVDRIGPLDETDERVVDIVKLQPSSNSELADRWGLSDGSAVYHVLTGELDRYAARNTDNYVCASESARRYINRLERQGKINTSKQPPTIPNQAKTVLTT